MAVDLQGDQIHFAVVEKMMSTATEQTKDLTKEYDLAIPPQTSY